MTSARDTRGQDESTLRFLRQSFSDYYAGARLQLPDRFGRREWGFMFFGRDSMLRHVALRSLDDVRRFLRREAPAHVYHSAAYYEKPDAQTMKDKKWLGADLIFDLDADHIEGSQAMKYEEMLLKVKQEFLRLIQDYLLNDFGFEVDDLQIVFSGGRGYHIHITCSSILELDSRERREIVDDITGTNLDFNPVECSPSMIQDGNRPIRGIFWSELQPRRSTERFTRRIGARRLHPADAPGWQGRMTRTILDFLDKFEELGEKVAVRRMTEIRGLGEVSAKHIYSDLFDKPKIGQSGAEKMRTQGIADVFRKEELALWFFKLIGETAGIPIEKKHNEKITDVWAPGETDEPVTSDIKRLIRMPTSLHGKTGFAVVPLTIDELKSFDPLKDAVVLPESPVRIEVKKALQVRLKGQDFRLEPGPAELPAYVAVFALGRGAATLAAK